MNRYLLNIGIISVLAMFGGLVVTHRVAARTARLDYKDIMYIYKQGYEESKLDCSNCHYNWKQDSSAFGGIVLKTHKFLKP